MHEPEAAVQWLYLRELNARGWCRKTSHCLASLRIILATVLDVILGKRVLRMLCSREFPLFGTFDDKSKLLFLLLSLFFFFSFLSFSFALDAFPSCIGPFRLQRSDPCSAPRLSHKKPHSNLNEWHNTRELSVYVSAPLYKSVRYSPPTPYPHTHLLAHPPALLPREE